jgi:dUTP pyrophosphatase
MYTGDAVTIVWFVFIYIYGSTYGKVSFGHCLFSLVTLHHFCAWFYDTVLPLFQRFKIQLVSPHATVPTRSTPGSAGYDLSACEDVVIQPGERATVNVGLKFAFPRHCYVRIAARSGLAVNHGISVLAGVVDSDFRGEVKVILHNGGTQPVEVRVGDRVAQALFESVKLPKLRVVQSLDDTTRGAGGLGSTGLR